MMRMTMSDFIEICKFNEAINRDIEEDLYDDIDEEDDIEEEDDTEEWWRDLRNDDFIKEAIEQRHEREHRQNEFYL